MDIFLVLKDVYKCLQAGERPIKENHELASLFCSTVGGDPSCVNTRVCENDDSSSPQRSLEPELSCSPAGRGEYEVLCFALSLMETISIKLLSGSQAEDVRLYYKKTLTISLEDMALMTKLVSLFGNEDRLVSHFAAKCASSVVMFQLRESNLFNSVWQERCIQILHSHHLGNDMCCALWSITAVIKWLWIGAYKHKKVALEQLVLMLDAALPELYMGLHAWVDRGRNAPMAAQRGALELESSLVALLDLFEVLCSVRLSLEVCSLSQRLLFHQASVSLQLVCSANVHYLVQKRALVLLKTILLHKAGEDLVPGAMTPPPGEDDHVTADMLVLSDAVQQAVHSDWLGHMSVRTEASFFGGSCLSSGRGPDFVMLRAASLVLLKSLEYKIQYEKKEGREPAIDLHPYLVTLMIFLGQHLTGFSQLQHRCVWVSTVFGEQDDDMIEAARVVLNLYLHARRSGGVTNLDSCDLGCDPHCHFILLLQSIAFDHSVLLDFLISMETCFLDYFVKYLKLLRDSWEVFECACQRVETLGSEVIVCQRSPATGHATAASHVECLEDPLCGGIGRSCSSQSAPLAGGLAQTAAHPLVDYSSSDDSEEGSRAVSAPVERTPSLDRGEACNSDLSTSYLHSDTGVLCLEQRLPASCVCRRTLACLTQLKRLIVRLQRRNLFPYKPASLLKLLADVEAKSGLEREVPVL